MSFTELFLLAVGLSMDAFAVSICKGLCSGKATVKGSLLCGSWFGGFQALMPLIGFFIGGLFAKAIEAFDHWVAFGLLAIIGLNMIKEALFPGKDDNTNCADFSAKAMFVMAVATSIDALAVGIGLSAAGGVNIWLAVALIGVITFVLSGIGVKVGSIFGAKFEKPAQLLGGAILILLGVKILLDHMLPGV